MPDQRKRIGPLDTAGSVAIENAKVYKELRRGRIEPSLAFTPEPDPDQSTRDPGELRRRETQALLEAAGKGRLIELKSNG